jgi:ABC-type multidrug transport system ATPase subunit
MLAQRKTQGRLQGQVLVNGRAATGPGSLSGRMAYVPQQDALMPLLTVHETLDCYARLTIPAARGGASSAAVSARVQEVLALLGLSDQQQSLVSGCGMRGAASDDERKA